MGDVGTVAIYPHYGASFQVILVLQDSDSPHLKKPTASLIMHFEEAPLFTNLVDKHIL